MPGPTVPGSPGTIRETAVLPPIIGQNRIAGKQCLQQKVCWLYYDLRCSSLISVNKAGPQTKAASDSSKIR